MDADGHVWEYDQPSCIEDYEWNPFHFWDFGYWKWHNFNEDPKWFRTPNDNVWDAFVAWNAVFDYGRLGDGYYEGAINQQIGMGANWPAFDPPEPRYAHHNGWWHEVGNGWDAKVTAAHRWQLHSHTIDVWYKYYQVYAGTLFIKPGPTAGVNAFASGQNPVPGGLANTEGVTYVLNGTPNVIVNMPFNPNTDFNKWFISQFVIR